MLVTHLKFNRGFFFLGGLVGALGFKHVGYLSTVPLALLLIALASVPAVDDLRTWRRRWAAKPDTD